MANPWGRLLGTLLADGKRERKSKHSEIQGVKAKAEETRQGKTETQDGDGSGSRGTETRKNRSPGWRHGQK